MKRNSKKRNYALLLLLILVVVCSFMGNAQNYSIKNRWNTKIGYSRNQIDDITLPIAWPDSWGDIPTINKRASNFRIELNYGVLNWLEVGIYGGFTHYKPNKVIVFLPDTLIEGMIVDVEWTREDALAPTFGVNVNFHLLPLFVKKEKCRWEWYITAKYGGAYFSKWNNGYYNMTVPSHMEENDDGSWTVYIDGHANPHRYRHEFGIGMGAGVYFWNTFGLYIEVCGGQYSYFPDLFKAWHSIRGGIEFKFTPKPKKKLE